MSDSPVLNLLQELVRRDSVTPRDEGCQTLIADRLRQVGFHIEHLRSGDTDNLWATHGSGSPLVCLAGHTDVVPPGPLAAWTSAPFEPAIRNGRLYGRGASDMKASDAAMVVALERLAAERHSGTVALLLTSDEEGLGVNGTKRVLETLAGRHTVINAAIVGEPSSERVFGDVVKHGRRGSLTGSICVSGVQGHTAYPQLASNSVHKLAPALNELIAIDWGAGDDSFPPATLQISNVRAGTGANNVIPGHCDLQFNIRFGASITVGTIVERVEGLFRRHGITDRFVWNASALPFVTQPGALLESLERAVLGVTGVTPRRSTGGGTSDARYFAAHGIPVAEFGPLNESIHAIDENVELACLEPLADVYYRTLTYLIQ